MSIRFLPRLGVIGALGLAAAATTGHAASFSLFGDQSVVGTGTAGAGGAASAYDASTIFYNPAGMSFLPGKFTITTGSNYIIPDLKYTDSGRSLNAPGTPLQRQLTGGSGGQGGAPGFKFFGQTVPQLYLAYQITDRVALGLGVSAPFGLETSWDPTSIMRYHATNSRITDVNFNPALSFKILPNLSLGVGLDISYLQTGLSAAVDYGLINASFVGGVQGGVAANAGIPAAIRGTAANAAAGGAIAAVGSTTPGARDGFVRFGGDAIGIGWNIGLLWEPIPGTKLGVSYRHNIEHDIEGNARYTLVPNYAAAPASIQAAVTAALTPLVGAPTAGAVATGIATSVTPSANGLAGRFINGRPITATLNLPATASFSFSQKVPNCGLTILGDVTWTRWSSFDKLEIINADTGSVAAFQRANYKDVFRYSLGATYDYRNLTFRAGYAYDNTPIPNSVDRTPRLPDNDRHTIAVGFSYRVSDRMELNLAYNHLFIANSRVDNLDASGLHRLVGNFNGSADIIAFGSTLKFGPKTTSVQRPDAKTVYTK